ncbi:MAG: hypothetical protein KUL83_00100 [Lentimicrobium sp.]|jgi:hypothetical protein|nr:hypothetical protein [Lentimicrobium sp.]MDD2527865.1 hypothetical protein [Lentimicrobiaceae bacterium]MDD4596939.1 hypothetical protein [Lentimicrobiaceae bacterium]MDY0024379.1 hypothetical protein [Lentimicrobium sp.]HAH56702.1 hypothetical protein [Bacteroidales bacterium]
MDKKRVIVSYNNLSQDVLDAIKLKYPLGYSNNVIKVKTRGEEFFYAITVDTADASYLVKVPVKIDTKGLQDEDIADDADDEKDTPDDGFIDEAASDSDE